MDIQLRNFLNELNKASKELGIQSLNIEDFDWRYIVSLVPHRAIFLKSVCQFLNISIRSIAEIGVWQGESSKLFSMLFPKAQLYLVDPWKCSSEYLLKENGPMSSNSKAFENAYKRVKKTFQKNPNCKILRKTSLKAASRVPDELDLVFIDGAHSYENVKQDIALWLPKVRKGGILSGHDYSLEHPGVLKAVDEAFDKKIKIGYDRTWIYLNIY